MRSIQLRPDINAARLHEDLQSELGLRFIGISTGAGRAWGWVVDDFGEDELLVLRQLESVHDPMLPSAEQAEAQNIRDRRQQALDALPTDAEIAALTGIQRRFALILLWLAWEVTRLLRSRVDD